MEKHGKLNDSQTEKIEWENKSTYLDLFLFENEGVSLQLIHGTYGNNKNSQNTFNIYSTGKEKKQSWNRHCTGRFVEGSAILPEDISLEDMRKKCSRFAQVSSIT